MRNRHTMAGIARFDGVGIHSGLRSAVTVSPLSKGKGIYFGFGGVIYPVRDARTMDVRRSTALMFPGGETVQTVEHLMSAIAGVGLDDVLIEPEGSEMPILDGSSLPYAERIMEIGLEERDEPVKTQALSVPVFLNLDGSTITAAPSSETRLTYIIDYPGTWIGTEMKDVILTPEVYLEEIAPARTFGLQSEVESLRASGLGLGGDFDNVMIIGDDGPLNCLGYRVERECAAHKILDLLGDLLTLGVVPRAHYTCICGGHRLHSKLTDRLKRLV